MSNNDSKGNAFSGLIGFLMTAIGFAVGIGSIWRFPYMLGTNGGSLFLFVYVGIILLIGVPLYVAETTMGFKTQKTAVLAYRELAPSPKQRFWSYGGYLHLLAALIIISYSIPIYAWILGYLFNTIKGTFVGMDAQGLNDFFNSFSTNMPQLIIFAILNLVICGVIVSGGVQKGVEMLTKVLLPILGVVMVILIVAGIRMEGSSKGFAFLFQPDASAFTIASLKEVLGQAFFALGIGMLAAEVFGSYIKNPKENIGKSATIISIALVSAGVMAGMMIFPALFAADFEATSSVGLVFLTVPLVFNSMPGGQILGALFFFGFYIAAITSTVGVVEAIVGMFMDQFGMTRKKGLLITIAIMAVVGFLCLPASSIFTFFDSIINYLLIAGVFIISIFVGWIWGADNFIEATNIQSPALRSWVKIAVKYLSPLVIVAFLVISFI